MSVDVIVGDVSNYIVSFQPVLDTGETFTGTPTVTATTGMTISSIGLNASEKDVNQTPVGANRAVTFKGTATQAGDIVITMQCTTTLGQSPKKRIHLRVVA